MELIDTAAAKTVSAVRRTRELRREATRLGGEARHQRRRRQIRAVVRATEQIARELQGLEEEIDLWDGAAPPLAELTSRLELVEIELARVEAILEAFRARPAE
jgi:chromosome segregation ATPase